MKAKKRSISKFQLICSIQESIKGPTFFAQKYWEHIEKGGDPDVF